MLDTVANLCRGDSTGRLEVRLSDAAQAARAVGVLSALSRSATVRAEDDTVIAEVNGVTTPEIVAALVYAGLDIEEITRPIKSLEDVYFEIMREEVT